MDIRIFLFLLIIVAGLIIKSSGDNKRNRERYINVALIALLLESCLRGLSVGSDTYKYSEIFSYVGQMSWDEIFQSIINRYLYNVDDTDAGYLLFQKLVHLFSDDFNFFLLACAVPFFIPFKKLLLWVDLDLDQLILLFVFYVALFNPIAMSGTRKLIALGLSIQVFLYYIDKKYIKATIWFVIAFSIHMTVLVILLVPFIDVLSNRLKKIIHGITFFFVPTMIALSSTIILFMATSVENEHYEQYARNPEGGGWTFVILIELIFFMCLVNFKTSYLNNSPKLSHLYSMLPMATLLAPLITNNGSMIRLSQYFHLYTLFFLPMLVDKIVGKENRNYANAFLIAVLIVMCLHTGTLGSEYYFFWENSAPVNAIIDTQ